MGEYREGDEPIRREDRDEVETPQSKAERVHAAMKAAAESAGVSLEELLGAVQGAVPRRAPLTGEPGPADWFSRAATGEGPPRSEAEVDPETATELYTAVLLAHHHNGTVAPITNVPGLKLHHQATPHEVLRMCFDVADQISGVRMIGQVIQSVHKIAQHSARELFNALTSGSPQPGGE